MIFVQPFQAAHGGQFFRWWHGEPPAVAQLFDLTLDVPAGFRREHLDQGCTGGYGSGVQVDELGDPLGDPVGHAGDHEAGVAVAQKDDVVQILELDEVDDVLYVRLEVHLGTGEVLPFAQAREGDGVDVVTVFSQAPGDGLPAPASQPRAADQNVGSSSAEPPRDPLDSNDSIPTLQRSGKLPETIHELKADRGYASRTASSVREASS